MNRNIARFSFLIVAFLTVMAVHAAPKTGLTTNPNRKIFVHSISEAGKPIVGLEHVSWSPLNNRLLIDQRGLSRYYSVYSVTPEGFHRKGLTFSMPGGGSSLHCGGASWAKDEKHFIFSAQNRGTAEYKRSTPNIGWHTNLWLGDKNGETFWKLTKLSSSTSRPLGAMNAQFSPDGKKVFWTGCNGKINSSPYRERDLNIADFDFTGSEPVLKNIKTFQPGNAKDFYESYGFSPDGNRIIFAGNMEEGIPWYNMDICIYDRNSRELAQLTNSPRSMERYATYSPDGKKVVWASSRGFSFVYGFGATGERWRRYLKSELWIMDGDGKNAKQLTFFNTEGHPHYTGKRTFVGDSVWIKDGEYILLTIHQEVENYATQSRVITLKMGKDKPAFFQWNDPNRKIVSPAATPKKEKKESGTEDQKTEKKPQKKNNGLPVW